MEHIFNKSHDSHLINSDIDIMDDDDKGLATIKQEFDYSTYLPSASKPEYSQVKQENSYLESDIIMPEAPQTNVILPSPRPKKEVKTKKEIEEEEREKMQ